MHNWTRQELFDAMICQLWIVVDTRNGAITCRIQNIGIEDGSGYNFIVKAVTRESKTLRFFVRCTRPSGNVRGTLLV